jgi:hypothetical protein
MARGFIIATVVAAFLCAQAIGSEVNVKPGHPKVMLTKGDIARAAANIKAGGRNWTGIKSAIDAGTAAAPAYGLVYQATGDEAIGKKGVEVLMKAKGAEDIALGYDWLYKLLSEEQKKTLFDNISAAVAKDATGKMDSPWTNFVQRSTMRLAMAGCAFTSEFPDAQKWVDKAYADWETFHLPAVLITGEGGGWPEGTLYSYIVFSSLTRLADTFWTATDKDIYKETPWFADRMTWWRFHTWPLPKDFNGARFFYMYDPYGDSERWRAPMQNQEIEAEFLVMRYAEETVAGIQFIDDFPLEWSVAEQAKEWRWYMKQLNSLLVSRGSWAALAYYDETATVKEPTALSLYAKGTGQIFVRSSWKPDATWLAIQGGPRFTYHQHLDKGQINIFKEGDLTGESGVYEPSGPSDQEGHLQGYASRAIAHNTINIYDPAEVFSGYRSGNSPRDDGGERTWRPFSNTGTSAAYWQDGFAKGAYDTGRVVEFKDDGEVVYVALDLTGAYNSDKYVSEPNKSKVHEVTRQIVYFRPQKEGNLDCVAVFDRVRATDPSFEKRILWHFPNNVLVSGKETKVAEGEFAYDGDLAETDTGGGRLFIRSVYPKGARINKVGGPDKEYWVFGKNFPVPDTPWEHGYGSWRIEIMPPAQQNDDCFLTLLFPADKSAAGAPNVTRLAGKDTLGFQIGNEGKFQAQALFATTGEMGASVLAVTDIYRAYAAAQFKTIKHFGKVDAIDMNAKADGTSEMQFSMPLVTDVKVSDVTTEAVVTWKSDAPAVGYVEFGTDPEMKYLITPSDKPATEFKATLRGLAPEAKFYVRAAAKTADGRVGFSRMMELATPADTTAPRISKVDAGQPNPTDVTVSWSTDDLATGVVDCVGYDGVKISASTKAAAADQRVTVDGLKADTDYTLTVTARNAGGLESTSEAVKLTTPKVPEGYFECDFADGKIGPFEATNAQEWSVGKDSMSEKMALSLGNVSKKRNIIVYTGYEYGDFTLKCKARTVEGDGNEWRDFMIVFGYTDPQNYYLAGFNSSVDTDVPGIVRVKDGQSTPIANRLNIVTIPDRNWHNIEVTRKGARIQVFWDGLLCFEADDAALGKGKIGFGSFNDSAAFKELKVLPAATLATAPPEIRTKKLTVEGLVIE